MSTRRGTALLALQQACRAAYKLHLNGKLIGGAGNLGNGTFGMDTIRSFLTPQSLLAQQPATLAARITYGYADFSGYVQPLPVGDPQVLEALCAEEVLPRIHRFLN